MTLTEAIYQAALAQWKAQQAAARTEMKKAA